MLTDKFTPRYAQKPLQVTVKKGSILTAEKGVDQVTAKKGSILTAEKGVDQVTRNSSLLKKKLRHSSLTGGERPIEADHDLEGQENTWSSTTTRSRKLDV